MALTNILIIIISFLVSLLFILGTFNLLTRNEENGMCEMTYMFQYPQFIRVRLKEDYKYPQYGLYAYSEGEFTSKVREMKFKGIPVLFIPGNAGSFKQVRSLSSVALRKAVHMSAGFHFDFFTVDLNEELSGIFGGVLESQAQFVNHSIYRILELYSNSKRRQIPKSVVLIGHSMGGMVALKTITNPKDAENVELIITLSTPHLRPAILFDRNMQIFYDIVEGGWFPRKDYLTNKTIISIGAGFSDRLVHTHLTQSKYSNLHITTTGIPLVWIDMEHVVILWCKQLVKTIIRALFDCVDPATLYITDDSSRREQIFYHHLVHNSGIKWKYKQLYNNTVYHSSKDLWIEFTDLQNTFQITYSPRRTQWYMFPLKFGDPNYKQIVIQALDFDQTDWVYFCTASTGLDRTQFCNRMFHLTQLSTIVPSQIGKRRELSINLEESRTSLDEATHIVVKIPPGTVNAKLDVDIFDPKSRVIEVDVPLFTFLYAKDVLFNTVPGALKYIIQLNDFDYVYQALSLSVVSDCTEPNYQTVATLKVPWAHNDIHGYFIPTSKKSMPLMLFSSKPHSARNMSSFVELSLDSSCRYQIKIESNFILLLEQLARHYMIMLIGNTGAILLLVLRHQLIQSNQCPSIYTSLINATKPYYLMILLQILIRLLNSDFFTTIFDFPDIAKLEKENMDFVLLPLILFIASIGLIYTISIGLWLGIVLGGSTVQKLALKFLCKRMFGFMNVSEWVLNCLQNLSTGVVGILVSLGSSTTGSLTLILGAFYYFLKLIKMYEDYLENLVRSSIKYITKTISRKIFSKSSSSQNVGSTEGQEEVKSDASEVKDLIEAASTSITEIKDAEKSEDVSETSRKSSSETSDDFEKIDIAENVKKSIENLDRVEELTKDEFKSEDNSECGAGSPDDAVEKLVEEDDTEKQIVVANNENLEIVETTSDEPEKPVNTVSQNEDLLSGLNFHFTVFLIWCLVAAVSIPSVLTWARNFWYEKSLSNDPSYIPSIIMSIAAVFLWDLESPNLNLKFRDQLGDVLYVLALIAIIYSSLTLYRLPYLLSAGVLLVALHQRIAPANEEQSIEDDTEEEEQRLLKLKSE